MIKIRQGLQWLRLLMIQYIIDWYHESGEPKLKLLNKSLNKRDKLYIIKLKVNFFTHAIIIATMKDNHKHTLFVDVLWVRSMGKKIQYANAYYEESTSYLETVYHVLETFFVNKNIKKVAIPIDITNTITVESFRRLITIRGFTPDEELTLEDITFNKPYREQETVSNVVYSRFYR